MKRWLILLLLLVARPANADILVVCSDTLYASVGAQKNMGHFFELLRRSVGPGVRINVATSDTFKLAELRDEVHPAASSPLFKASLMVMVQSDRNAVVLNPTRTSRIAMTQLSKMAHRPKVPVLYMNLGTDVSFQSGGNCSLGTTGAQLNGIGTGQMATTPAGYVFPVNSDAWARGAGGALPATGNYVTPVAWLACYNYTKADPNGVGGTLNTGAAYSDTMWAWFYNPPNSTTYTDRTTTGFGVIQMTSAANNAGGAQYPDAGWSAIAVGMAAYLAPDQFKFPAVKVALDIDDGCKRFSSASSLPQVQDYLAGLDSLGVARIPYTVGIEVDSMDTMESNGLTRFQNEFTAYRKYGMGKVTVHVHRGVSIADSSSSASASGPYSDIMGAVAMRYSIAGPSAATKDKSTLFQLDGATRKLIDYAGDSRFVTSHVMAPTDNYKTILAGTSVVGVTGAPRPASYDSIGYALSLAAMGYKGFPGYKVVRTQYVATQYNFNQGGGTGGLPRGVSYPLPSLQSYASILFGARTSRSSILYAPSSYIYGTTTDTVSAADHGAMRINSNSHIGRAFGFTRPYDVTQAQDAAGGSVTPYYGSNKETIFVTHVPNWRNGIGVTPNGPFSGPRPAWEAVRLSHAYIETAKWCAQRANTDSHTYFRDGPIKWVYSDEFSEGDVR